MKGELKSKLEEDTKAITQKMESKPSDFIKRIKDTEYRLDEVNFQMNSFSVDMSSATKALKEVKGKQSGMKTKIESNKDTLIIVNEKIHRFSNETDILRNEIERLDVNSSELNKRMKSNEMNTRVLYSNSKKVDDQIKNLENNTQELEGVCLPMLKRVNNTEERLDGVDRLFNVINADLYDISKF